MTQRVKFFSLETKPSDFVANQIEIQGRKYAVSYFGYSLWVAVTALWGAGMTSTEINLGELGKARASYAGYFAAAEKFLPVNGRAEFHAIGKQDNTTGMIGIGTNIEEHARIASIFEANFNMREIIRG